MEEDIALNTESTASASNANSTASSQSTEKELADQCDSSISHLLKVVSSPYKVQMEAKEHNSHQLQEPHIANEITHKLPSELRETSQFTELLQKSAELQKITESAMEVEEHSTTETTLVDSTDLNSKEPKLCEISTTIESDLMNKRNSSVFEKDQVPTCSTEDILKTDAKPLDEMTAAAEELSQAEHDIEKKEDTTLDDDTLSQDSSIILCTAVAPEVIDLDSDDDYEIPEKKVAMEVFAEGHKANEDQIAEKPLTDLIELIAKDCIETTKKSLQDNNLAGYSKILSSSMAEEYGIRYTDDTFEPHLVESNFSVSQAHDFQENVQHEHYNDPENIPAVEKFIKVKETNFTPDEEVKPVEILEKKDSKEEKPDKAESEKTATNEQIKLQEITHTSNSVEKKLDEPVIETEEIETVKTVEVESSLNADELSSVVLENKSSDQDLEIKTPSTLETTVDSTKVEDEVEMVDLTDVPASEITIADSNEVGNTSEKILKEVKNTVDSITEQDNVKLTTTAVFQEPETKATEKAEESECIAKKSENLAEKPDADDIVIDDKSPAKTTTIDSEEVLALSKDHMEKPVDECSDQKSDEHLQDPEDQPSNNSIELENQMDLDDDNISIISMEVDENFDEFSNDKVKEPDSASSVKTGTAERLEEKELSSSEDENSEHDYYENKECINPNCLLSSNKFLKASVSNLNFYYIKQKKQMQFICKKCHKNSNKSFSNMCDMLLKGEPIILAERPRQQDLVQVIDSSDEEDSEKTDTEFQEPLFTDETMAMIDEELEGTIVSMLEKADIDEQIKKSEKILYDKLQNMFEDSLEMSKSLNKLQITADNIAKGLFSCTKINFKHVVEVDLGINFISENKGDDFGVPPSGVNTYPPISKGKEYYGVIKDLISSWAVGTIMDFDSSTNLYVVKFQQSQAYVKAIAKKHLAYMDAAEKRLEAGSRVIARFDSSTAQSSSSINNCPFYPGIVAEPAKNQNKNRYLIFFDHGYAQYVRHSNIRLVCHVNENVWEDVYVANRDFIHDYIKQYQVHRPMVRTTKNQRMLVKWDDKFFNSKVLDIDCSLIKMQSERNPHKIEWIYRGSRRLEPVYKAYRKDLAAQLQSKQDVEFLRRNMKPSHSRLPLQMQAPGMNMAIRAVAKKSTSGGRQIEFRQHQGIPRPQPVKHLNNAIIYLEDDNKPKGNIVYNTVKINKPPSEYIEHDCSTSCLRDEKIELALYSPLSKPLLSGWDRQIYRSKSKKYVVYKAPCGFSCRNMKSLHKYLRITNNPLNVENFDFSWDVSCLAEYVVKNYKMKINDLSMGLEKLPVQCINYYDNTLPPACEYSNVRIPTDGVNLNLDDNFLVGCDCEGDCSNRADCACWQLTLKGSKYASTSVADMGYQYKRLYESVQTGIYECNSRCKCSSKCVNRVVQHPLDLKLQVFKTSNRGWGIRCLNDIPRGSFVCVYAGNLLNEQNANENGKEGDEYYAELDYIEVVERIKEGYESDAESMSQSDSDSEYNPEDHDDIEWTSSKKSSKPTGTRSKRKLALSRFVNEDSPQKYRSIRKYYGKNEACYVMDAKVTGNLGRYFNHSCAPNLFVQNVFVDTHDLRFPWVAFFSMNSIRAGTELTWNYNYEVGVVPGKVLYCECGADNCRGRLL